MTPVNSKLMISFLFDQMNKLDQGVIDSKQAKEQSNLAKQINTAMKYELDRAKTKMSIKKHNEKFGDSVQLRDIESQEL